MKSVPPKLLRAYQEQLNTSGIAHTQQPYYLKWFRYYYDFCLKYALKGIKPETCLAFRSKLRSKGQAEDLIRQAEKAVELYRQMAGNLSAREVRQKPPQAGEARSRKTLEQSIGSEQQCTTDENRPKRAEVAQPQLHRKGLSLPIIKDRETLNNPGNATGSDWTNLYNDLRSAIQVRHYSSKTLHSWFLSRICG